MQITNNPAIVGEYRNYRDMILASAPEKVEQQGDSVRLSSRIDIDRRSDGVYLSRKVLAAGSVVGGERETIVEHYSFDSIFGVQETAWRVDTVYIRYQDDGRAIIEKTSTDRVHEDLLSRERVDASTGEVIDQWFIADYKQRVMEPRHSCIEAPIPAF